MRLIEIAGNIMPKYSSQLKFQTYFTKIIKCSGKNQVPSLEDCTSKVSQAKLSIFCPFFSSDYLIEN